LLFQYDGKGVYYRTISPRAFEAAAVRSCQILFEGRYSGILKPMVHYIPLQKDFSNFDEVIALYRDESFRRQLTDNAHRDLIASGKYSYQKFIERFDRLFMEMGMDSEIYYQDAQELTKCLSEDRIYMKIKIKMKQIEETIRKWKNHLKQWTGNKIPFLKTIRSKMRALGNNNSKV
jgi:hypothetical protein